MAPKHCWSKVGDQSKEQIVDLLGRAMAEGHHSDYGSQARKAEWSYQGQPIIKMAVKSATVGLTRLQENADE